MTSRSSWLKMPLCHLGIRLARRLPATAFASQQCGSQPTGKVERVVLFVQVGIARRVSVAGASSMSATVVLCLANGATCPAADQPCVYTCNMEHMTASQSTYIVFAFQWLKAN